MISHALYNTLFFTTDINRHKFYLLFSAKKVIDEQLPFSWASYYVKIRMLHIWHTSFHI
jgi:hypothetical protein